MKRFNEKKGLGDEEWRRRKYLERVLSIPCLPGQRV